MRKNHPMRHGFAMRSLSVKAFLLFFLLFFSFFQSNAQNCTINAGVDQTVCANSVMTLSGTKSGLFQGAGTTTWSQVSGAPATITSPNALTTTVTGFSAGNYIFRLSTTCQDGSFINDEVSVTVSPIVIANAGPDQTYCPSTVALSGNVPAPGTGAWSIIGTNNANLTIATTSSATSNITLPTGSAGATTLRWTITQGACTSTDDVIITNRGGVTPVTAGPDQTLGGCYTSTTSATFAASFAGNAGGQIGTWTLVSGPNTPTITSPNTRNSTVTDLVQGVYTFRWTVAGPCVNGTADVRITVPPPTSSLTSANGGGNQTFCDARTSVVLSGNNPTYAGETVQWIQTSGPAATISSPTSPVTTVTGLNGSSSYGFQYIITNTSSNCTSTSNVTVSYNTAPSILVNSGADYITLACGATTASIPYTASGGNLTQYRVISAPVGYTLPGSFTNASASPQSVTGLTVPGTYVIRFQRSGGTGCATAYDDVNVIVSRSPSPSAAGTFQVLACNVVSTSLAGNIPTVGTGSWSQMSGPNTATIVNPNSNTSGISGLVNGRYLFKWIISGGNACPALEDTVSVVVASTTPTAANAGADRTVCNGSPIVLSGNQPVLNETGAWSVSPSAGVAFSNVNSPSATVTGLQANTVYTFTWTIFNACGTTSDDVLITTNNSVGPVQATAGADQCLPAGTTSATLSGNAASPVGATASWSQHSGPSSATIASPSAASSSVSGLTNGTYEFVRIMSFGSCSSTTDTVVVTISAAATTANAGPDQTICASSVTLAGNTISVGTGTWTQVGGPGGAMITSPSANNTTVSNLATGSYTFRWLVTNSGCAGNFDDVLVNVGNAPSAAAAGPNQTCLTTTTVTMNATVPSNGTGVWSQVSGPAPATITTAGANNTTITGLSNGSYTFRWTVSSGPSCAPTTSDMIVSVNQAASAGSNSTICNVTATSLSGNANSNGTWSQVSGPNTATITALSGFTASAENLVPGVYIFRYTLTPVSGCAPSQADRQITVAAPPSAAVAGTNQSVCNSSSFSLSATAPTVGTGTWTRVSGPTTGSFSPNATTANATFNGAAAGLYTFQWTVSNGGCSNASQVTVTNSLPASTADAGVDQSFCGPSTTNLGAVAPSSGSAAWTQVSGPTTVTFANPALPNTAVTGLGTGQYTFRWTVASGACAANSDDMTVLSCTVLPVDLLSLSVEKRAADAVIGWTTANETGISSYGVEASLDGTQFMSIGKVIAKPGFSNVYQFPYSLSGIRGSKIYFRLKQNAVSGGSTYSRVVSLMLDRLNEFSVKVTPNPVRDIITLQVQAITARDATIRLIDGAGKALVTMKKRMNIGANSFALPGTQTLINGVYIVLVETNGNTCFDRVVVDRL